MKNGILALAICATALAHAGEGSIKIYATRVGAKIPSSLYGVFLEEINNAVEGGLYAEMVQNRGFEDANVPPTCTIKDGQIVPPRTNHFWEGKPVSYTLPWPVTSPYPGWSLSGDHASMELVQNHPLSPQSPHSLCVSVASGEAIVANEGFWGMGIKKGEGYNLSLYARTDSSYKGKLKASLVGADGKVLASTTFQSVPNGGWKKLSAKFTALGTDPKAKLCLTLSGVGKVWFDFVSLFPAKTFLNRPNGLRPDIAQMVADLKPGFIRYPGGCYVEGLTIETRPRWERTLGPIEQREATYAPWGYWSSNGFGYHEWLQFCEDVHSEALYVFNVGVSCAFRSGTYIPDDQLQPLIDNTVDAIEYAIGPTTSKWGALRAQNGHPKPFPLHYVEVGNEQSGPRYGARVKRFSEAIRAKFPQVKVILSSWISGIDHAAINSAGKLDFVDEHAYTGSYWGISNYDHFAKYPRNVDWRLYIGEFACNGDVDRGNFLATLNDAAYMMDMEHNADLVKMGSYAPLLENVNRREWDVNLIHYDSSQIFGRASYYACKLFAENRPDFNLEPTVTYSPSTASPIVGPIGFGTYGTAAQFKDVRLEQAGSVVYQSAMDGVDPKWKPRNGDWKFANGTYEQSSEDWDCWTFVGEGYKDATLSFKGRKLHGGEGFVVGVGLADGRRVQFNVGGWGNHQHTLEAEGLIKGVPGSIEPGRWYDVRVETKGREVKAFLDGKLVIDQAIPRIDKVLTLVGRDAKTGDVVLKALNTGDEPADMKISLDGFEGLGREAKVSELASADVHAENSFEEPTKIVPKVSKITVSPEFSHVFPARSLTVIRFSAKPGKELGAGK